MADKPFKLPKTLRLDESDTHVFEAAAPAGEWAIPGGFAFAAWDLGNLTLKQRFAFAQGFLGLGSFGRSTVVAVASASEEDRDLAVDALAGHLLERYGAPSPDAARAAAVQEIDFAQELCDGLSINRLLMVERDVDDSGQIVERFRSAAKPGPLDHTKIWTLVPDDEPAAALNGED